MAIAEKGKAKKGSGLRRRFGGKMVREFRNSEGQVTSRGPRSNTHGGRTPAAAGYSCGDTALTDPRQYESRALPGEYKVQGPTKRAHRRGSYESIA